MAIKTIDLVINTSKGEQNVKKLHQLAKQVEKTFGNLNKLKINIKTAPAQQKLTALQKEINKGNRKIKSFLGTANPGMRAFGNSIGTARDNLAAVRKAFDVATNATDRQNGAITLLAGNFRKLNMEAVAFAKASGADPSKTIGNVSARIKAIQGFPRTIMAGNEAMSMLKRMQEMTIVGSKEFLEVSKAIGVQLGINANIQTQAARAAKPMTASTAFVSQEQLQALGRNKLVPPNMRLPAAGQSSGTFEIKSRPIENAVKNIQKSSNKTANILTQQSAFGMLPPAGGTTSPINARFSRANLGFGRNANPQGIFAMPGGMTGRLKGAAGSAMIGGGFPALFGAGGISSVMGGIAGGIGGALAPGGGFAASIVATAAAAQIEKTMELRKSLRKLNEEVTSMGISSEFSMKNIKALANEFEITNEEAIKLASSVKTFGEKQGLGIIQAFGSVETFRTLAGLRDTESVLNKIQELQGEISEEKRQELLNTLMIKGALKAQSDLQQAILDKGEKAFIKSDKRQKDKKSKKRAASSMGMMLGLDNLVNERTDSNKLRQQFNEANEPQVRFLQKQIELNEKLRYLAEFQAPTDELRELMNPMRQIIDLSNAIRTGFEDSFKGIVKGTMSVQDAFRNMFNRIADHFLDMAARMVAAQLQKGFLGLFSNMFSFGGGNNFTRDPVSATPTLTSEQQVSRFTFGRADGGPVKGGNSYLVGERGPEMFSPGVSGMITPNHALGGSTNIVVNVDASGSSVEGDGQQGEQLGALLATTIRSTIIEEQRPGGLLS